MLHLRPAVCRIWMFRRNPAGSDVSASVHAIGRGVPPALEVSTGVRSNLASAGRFPTQRLISNGIEVGKRLPVVRCFVVSSHSAGEPFPQIISIFLRRAKVFGIIHICDRTLQVSIPMRPLKGGSIRRNQPGRGDTTRQRNVFRGSFRHPEANGICKHIIHQLVQRSCSNEEIT